MNEEKNPNKRILTLAMPMALTQLISSASGFLCMTFLATLGQEVLAASALIFALATALVVLGMSFLFALSILVSHAFGARDNEQVGALYQQAVFLAFLVGLPLSWLFWEMGPILTVFKQDPHLIPYVDAFFKANVFRIFPLLLSICNQQLCYGVHKQKVDFYGNLLGMVVLLVSAYLLIFGKAGFPALGVVGLAYANDLQALAYFIFSSLCVFGFPYFKSFALFRWRGLARVISIKKLLQTGLPIVLQMNGEMLSFIVSAALVGWLGARELASYQIVLQYQFLVVIPLFAVAQASGVLVGQAYGAKHFQEIPGLGRASLKVAAGISLLGAFFFICFPRWLASFYLDLHDPANQKILELTITLFVFMACAQFFDGIRNVLTGYLRGLMDSQYPTWMGLACIWFIYLPIGYLIAIPLGFGLVGLFVSWLLAVILGALFLFRRFQKQNKRFEIVLD